MTETKNISPSFVPGVFVVLVLVVLGAGLLFLSQKKGQEAPSTTFFPSPTITLTTTVTPPPTNNQIALTITKPVDQTVVTTPTVVVSGKTVPNADVSVNDQELTADAQGNFSVTVNLEDGDNYIDITVNDQNGQSAQKEIMVTYQQP